MIVAPTPDQGRGDGPPEYIDIAGAEEARRMIEAAIRENCQGVQQEVWARRRKDMLGALRTLEAQLASDIRVYCRGARQWDGEP